MTVAQRPPPGSDGVALSRLAFLAACGTFLLIGALAAAYGPLLGQFTRRFDVSLPTAGVVLSASFGGALLGVAVMMALIERFSGRLVMAGALAVLALGCAAVAVALSWPALLAAVLVVGAGAGALDFGLNQLLAHSAVAGGSSSARLNVVHAQYGIGAVLGPLLVAATGDGALPVVFGGGAAVAVVLMLGLRGLSGRLHAPAAGGGRYRTLGLSPLVAAFVAAYVLYLGVESGVGGWMPTHLQRVGYGAAASAALTSAFWCALAVGRLLAAPLTRHVRDSVVVLTAAAAAVPALLLAVAVPAAPAAYVLTGLAIAPIFPTGVAWLARLDPGNPRNTSWLLVGSMLGGALFPPAVGAVIVRFGPTRTPVVLALLAAGSLVAFSAAARRRLVPV
jgi:FHS family glucose/mannose:H+ symporter-like MFS transporter